MFSQTATSTALEVFDTNSKNDMSVSVLDSDSISNALHMEVLVATLVKYGSAGVYEPYLAKSWQVNEKKTIYQFILNSGITDEQGNEIDAASFKKSLTRLLRIYSKSYSPPVFSDLEGWETFKNSSVSELSGIKVIDNNTLNFTFLKPTTGALEFLSMPYFGFYADANFNDLEWTDKHKIISSGPYSVASISKDNIVLKRRPNYFKAGFFESISIKKSALSDAINAESTNKLVLAGDMIDESAIGEMSVTKSVPTLLYAFVLNPNHEPFKNVEVRRAAAIHLRKIMSDSESDMRKFRFAKGFYKKDIDVLENVENLNEMSDLKFRFFIKSQNRNPHEELAYSVVKRFASETNSNVELVDADNFKGVMPAKLKNEFDLRLSRVDIGHSAENWVVKMMFCSDLGIAFPDSAGRICKLTDDFESGRFLDQNEYAMELERLLLEDSCVVPITRAGFTFLSSAWLQRESLSQTTNVPRLDLIKLND